MTDLSDNQLDILHRQLQHLQAELANQYEAGQAGAETVELDQSKIGRLSRMDAMQQQNMAKSTQRNLQQRLRQVNIALAKFDSGDYGYCDDCGVVIDAGRLSVQPEASCCFACQSKQEYHPQS